MISEKIQLNFNSIRIVRCIFRNSWYQKQKFLSLQNVSFNLKTKLQLLKNI